MTENARPADLAVNVAWCETDGKPLPTIAEQRECWRAGHEIDRGREPDKELGTQTTGAEAQSRPQPLVGTVVQPIVGEALQAFIRHLAEAGVSSEELAKLTAESERFMRLAFPPEPVRLAGDA